MTFEQERLAKERHDRLQHLLQLRFAAFDGKPAPRDIIEIVNRAIGETESDKELVYEYQIEDAP